MGLALLYAYRSQTPSVPTVPVTSAIQEINQGSVKSVTIIGNTAAIELTSGQKQQTKIADKDDIFQKAIVDYNTANPTRQVDLKYEENSQTFSVIGSILLSLLPVLLIGGFFFYMMRQAQGTNNQALSFGKSSARMFIGNKPTVTFDDVAGVEEAKQEPTEAVEFPKYPETLTSAGAEIPCRGASPARPVQPSGRARPPRHQGPEGDPRRARPGQAARQECRPAPYRADIAGLLGRGPRQRRERGRDPRRAPEQEADRTDRLRGGAREGRPRPGAPLARDHREREVDRRLPRGRPRALLQAPQAHQPGAQDLDRRPRHGHGRHLVASAGGPLLPDPHRVRGRHRRRARRLGRRTAPPRRGRHDRGFERHREGHRDGAADGHQIWHE